MTARDVANSRMDNETNDQCEARIAESRAFVTTTLSQTRSSNWPEGMMQRHDANASWRALILST
jgi:hypothetical protein